MGGKGGQVSTQVWANQLTLLLLAHSGLGSFLRHCQRLTGDKTSYLKIIQRLGGENEIFAFLGHGCCF